MYTEVNNAKDVDGSKYDNIQLLPLCEGNMAICTCKGNIEQHDRILPCTWYAPDQWDFWYSLWVLMKNNNTTCIFLPLFGDGWVRHRCRVFCVTGASNRDWPRVGQGLLSFQQVRVEGECFYFFCFSFIHFPLSPLFLFHVFYYLFYALSLTDDT